MQLYRAVGVNEARDLVEVGRFRVVPGASYQAGKWFATSFDDALRWGRALQRLRRGWSFRVAWVDVPATAFPEFERRDRLDAIGPAYFVGRDQLRALAGMDRIGLSAEVFAAEAGV